MKTPLDHISPGINIAVIRRRADRWEYLMLKRAADQTYTGYWGLLSGSRENNETVTNLALREMNEEIGQYPDRLWASEYCLQFFEPLDDAVWTLPVLVAEISAQAEIVLDEENEEYRWLSAAEAVTLAPWRNLREVLGWLEEDLRAYPPGNWVELPLR